jgi:hypothetical protein
VTSGKDNKTSDADEDEVFDKPIENLKTMQFNKIEKETTNV